MDQCRLKVGPGLPIRLQSHYLLTHLKSSPILDLRCHLGLSWLKFLFQFQFSQYDLSARQEDVTTFWGQQIQFFLRVV